MWFVDQYSTVSKQRRPVIAQAATPETYTADAAKTHTPCHMGSHATQEKTHTAGSDKPISSTRYEYPKDTPLHLHLHQEGESTSKLEVDFNSEVKCRWRPSEDHLSGFYRVGNSVVGRPIERLASDAKLLEMLSEYANTSDDVLSSAISAVNFVAGTKADDSAEPFKRGQFDRWFQTTLRNKICEIQRNKQRDAAAAVRDTKINDIAVETEAQVASKRLTLLDKTGDVHLAATARSAESRLAPVTSGFQRETAEPGRFRPSERFGGIVGTNTSMPAGDDANGILAAIPGSSKADIRKAWEHVTKWASETRSGRYSVGGGKNHGEVMERWRAEVLKIIKYREVGGGPKKFYGDPWEYDTTRTATWWVVLTKDLVDKIWTECPDLGRSRGPDSPVLHERLVPGSLDMIQKTLSLWSRHSVTNEDIKSAQRYGSGLQESFEASIWADARKEQAEIFANAAKAEEENRQLRAKRDAEVEEQRRQTEETDRLEKEWRAEQEAWRNSPEGIAAAQKQAEEDAKAAAYIAAKKEEREAKRQAERAERDAQFARHHRESMQKRNQELVDAGKFTFDPTSAKATSSLAQSPLAAGDSPCVRFQKQMRKATG